MHGILMASGMWFPHKMDVCNVLLGLTVFPHVAVIDNATLRQTLFPHLFYFRSVAKEEMASRLSFVHVNQFSQILFGRGKEMKSIV